VVEHPLGKGEVVSSILTGSTSKSGTSSLSSLQNSAEQSAKRRGNTPQIRPARSPFVHAECPANSSGCSPGRDVSASRSFRLRLKNPSHLFKHVGVPGTSLSHHRSGRTVSVQDKVAQRLQTMYRIQGSATSDFRSDWSRDEEDCSSTLSQLTRSEPRHI